MRLEDRLAAWLLAKRHRAVRVAIWVNSGLAGMQIALGNINALVHILLAASLLLWLRVLLTVRS